MTSPLLDNLTLNLKWPLLKDMVTFESFISAPDKLQRPDLKVSTRVWGVERNGNAYVEDGDDYFYDIVSSSDKAK